MSDASELDLENFLPYLVNRVGAAVVTDFTTHALAAEDLTIAMWRVLAALSNGGAQRQVDLSMMTSIEVSTLSRLVARLSRRGLVTRERSADDNREVTVTLSTQGRALVKRLVPIARALERKAAAGISAKELEAVKRHLRTMHDNLAGAGEEPRNERA
jgi:MarR family transcriptional regulator, organic hydroperoxide resistance regulator